MGFEGVVPFVLHDACIDVRTTPSSCAAFLSTHRAGYSCLAGFVVFCRDNQDTVAALRADVIGDDALIPLDDGNGGAACRAANAIGGLWLFF